MNRVILNDRVNAFNHLECELHLCRWFDKADNLWSNDDLPQVSRAIVCNCLRAYLWMNVRCEEFSKSFADRNSIHLSDNLICDWGCFWLQFRHRIIDQVEIYEILNDLHRVFVYFAARWHVWRSLIYADVFRLYWGILTKLVTFVTFLIFMLLPNKMIHL